MFSLFSKKINVKQIQKGRYLEKAIPKTVDDFMHKPMHNPIPKAVPYYEDLQDGVHFHHFTFRKPPQIQIKGEAFHIKVYATRNYISAPYQQLEGEAPPPQDIPRNYQIRLKRDNLELLEIETF